MGKINGFHVAMKAAQLAEAVNKISPLADKKEDKVVFKATDNVKEVTLKSGRTVTHVLFDVSIASRKGAANAFLDCQYLAYQESEGGKAGLEGAFPEESEAAFSFGQLSEIAKQLGTADAKIVIDCGITKKAASISMKAKTFSTELSIPIVDAPGKELASDSILAACTVSDGALKALSRTAMTILKTADAKQSLNKISLAVRKDCLEYFALDSSKFAHGNLRGEDVIEGIFPDYYGVCAEDFTSVVRTFGSGEKIKVEILGEKTPLSFRFSSINTGTTYVLPVYGTPLTKESGDKASAWTKNGKAVATASFSREDFMKAVSLVRIGFDNPAILMKIRKGEKRGEASITLSQPKSAGMSASFAGTVTGMKVPELETQINAPTFISIFNSLYLKEEEVNGEKVTEPAKVAVLDTCLFSFLNVAAGDSLACLGFRSDQAKLKELSAPKPETEETPEEAGETEAVS